MRVFDKDIVPIGTVDEMASLIWTVRYFSVGEMKILAPVTENNKALLIVGNVVVKHDGYTDYTDGDGNVWRRAAEITYIRYTKDATGQEQIEATGSLLSAWLNQRVITPQLALTATTQQIVNTLIAKNVGASAAVSRQFPSFDMLEQAEIEGTTFEYSNEALKALGDEVRDVCQQGKVGYDILVCEREKKYGFYLYKGADLTSGNADGNAPCIFSRDFDNVNEQDYEDSTENYKNFAYVLGAADSQNVQEIVTVDEEGATGLALKEVLVDASDISRSAEDESGEQADIPTERYRAMLESRGNAELAAMVENYTFNSSVNIQSNLRYKEDFDLGDRVTCIERRWGITINSRITEITQTYESGKTLLEATFGESAPTLLDKIKKVR